MTEEQKAWLDTHPNYSPVSYSPVVSIKQWTDKGYLLRNGTFVAEGKRIEFDGLQMISSEGTLYTNTRGAIHVGRHYEIC